MTLHLSDHLASLQKTRAELEAILEQDDTWRALQQQGDVNPGLTKALQSNTIYEAWLYLGEAISSLQRGQAASTGNSQPAADAAPSRAQPASRPRIEDDAPQQVERLPPLAAVEASEASVSFVKRSRASPAAGATEQAMHQNGFVAPAAVAEEAEVAVVKSPVKRFLDALSGN